MSTTLKQVKEYTEAAVASPLPALAGAIKKYLGTSLNFNAGHPINRLTSAAAVAEKFWRPLKEAFAGLKRVEQVAFEGVYLYNGHTWVTSTGRYVGNFVKPLYTIAPTGRYAQLRFGEFYRLEKGEIVETYCLLDYLQLIEQSGYRLLPKTLGSTEDAPAPRTGDGLQYGSTDEVKTKASQKVVVDMLLHLLPDRTTKGQKQFWSEQLAWYGPGGIGTFYTLEGFTRYRNAFLNSFPDRFGGMHKARFAKNNYVASTGWPSLYATHCGNGWWGLAATGRKLTMRVMDWWRVENGRIEENWVLIDLLNVFKQLEIDLLKNLERLYSSALFPVPNTTPEEMEQLKHDFETLPEHRENFKLTIGAHSHLYQ